MDSAVDQVRRFNRVVTQRVGALREPYLSRTLSLGEARVLWEIGLEGVEVQALRLRLGLDRGYLSRVLASLETAGLVRMVPSPRGGRVKVAEHAKRGLREREQLDSRSDELALSILEQVKPDDRDRLV